MWRSSTRAHFTHRWTNTFPTRRHYRIRPVPDSFPSEPTRSPPAAGAPPRWRRREDQLTTTYWSGNSNNYALVAAPIHRTSVSCAWTHDADFSGLLLVVLQGRTTEVFTPFGEM
jgi:hypothetical protein